MINKVNISLFPFCLIGLLCGGLFAYAPHYPDMPSKLLVDIWYYWIGFFGMTFLLAYQSNQNLFRLIISSIIVSFLAALPFAWQLPLYGSLSAFLLCMMNAYALNAFHLNYARSSYRISYHVLFDAVWNTGLQLFIALCFTLLCHLLMDAWGGLFAFIGVTFFQTLFSTAKFTLWSISFFFAIGLWIVIRANHIIQQCRSIILTICRYLLPPLSVIGILFIVCAFISLIASHQAITLTSNKNYFFLYFSFFSVLFINAAYRDEVVTPYSAFFTAMIRIFLCLAPIFTILPLYTIFRATIDTGNFAHTVNAALLFIYNIGYAFVAWRGLPQTRLIQKINIVLGVVVIITTLATTNPTLHQKLPKSAVFLQKITAQIN